MAARARNRPRAHLAWLILLALGVLVLVATRAHAAPPGDFAGGHEAEDEGSETGSEEGSEEAGDDTGRSGDVAAEDELADSDRLADLLEDAAVDDPLLREAIETGIVFSSTMVADAPELADLVQRRHRPSRFGRLDLTVAWRRTYDLVPIGVVLDAARVADATKYTHQIDDTFLLVATWRI